MYYRYWMHLAHHGVYAHYGVRTKRYKLIYYYADALGQLGAIDDPKEPEWELFDLEKDPHELNSVYHDPAYADVVAELTRRIGSPSGQGQGRTLRARQDADLHSRAWTTRSSRTSSCYGTTARPSNGSKRCPSATGGWGP